MAWLSKYKTRPMKNISEGEGSTKFHFQAEEMACLPTNIKFTLGYPNVTPLVLDLSEYSCRYTFSTGKHVKSYNHKLRPYTAATRQLGFVLSSPLFQQPIEVLVALQHFSMTDTAEKFKQGAPIFWCLLQWWDDSVGGEVRHDTPRCVVWFRRLLSAVSLRT